MGFDYSDKTFIKLCDIVAKNSLICFTGAGISRNLELKKGGKAPNWIELLKNIYYKMQKNNISFSPEEQLDLNELLNAHADGDLLIEAATILCEKNEKIFRKMLVESVQLKEKEKSPIHDAILKLQPKGIITFNYDNAHENSFTNEWECIFPDESDKITSLLKSSLEKQFLFKAHGCVSKPDTMILTGTSYRDLLNKNPHYMSFMQNIFSNYNFLFVGFGLSDPDFNQMLRDIFSIYGSPIQEHIVIKQEKKPIDIVLKRRYGLNFLYVSDYTEIPNILEQSTKTEGSLIKNILENCVSREYICRKSAHAKVRELSLIGKKCLRSLLNNKIAEGLGSNKLSEWMESEYVYTYGIIANYICDEETKNFLINIVEKSVYCESVAHALFHMRGIFDWDLYHERVENWMKQLENGILGSRDMTEKVSVYCNALYYCMKAREESINEQI